MSFPKGPAIRLAVIFPCFSVVSKLSLLVGDNRLVLTSKASRNKAHLVYYQKDTK